MLIIPKISRLSRSANCSNKKHRKRQLGANNLCYVPLLPLPLLFVSPVLLPSSPPPFSVFLFLSFFLYRSDRVMSFVQDFRLSLFCPIVEFPLRHYWGLSLSRSRNARLIDERRTEFETEASRLWSFRVNHRWKSPSYQVNELPTSPYPMGSRATWG